jgi:hypothetical protein
MILSRAFLERVEALLEDGKIRQHLTDVSAQLLGFGEREDTDGANRGSVFDDASHSGRLTRIAANAT